MERNAQSDQNALHSNGYLGGWVAAKALVGELNDAWRTLLENFDHQSNWDMQECLTGQPIQQCPQNETRQLDFPEALAKHLFKRGYISVDQEQQLLSKS